MGDYLELYFGSASAAPKAVEYDKAMLVGNKGSSSKSNAILEISQADDLLDEGFDSGDQLYKSAADFFAAGENNPNRLFCYVYDADDTGTLYEDMRLDYLGGNQFSTPSTPPEQFHLSSEKVYFYGQGDDVSDSGAENYADGSAGLAFTVETDSEGNWTGGLTFDNGLSGYDGIVEDLDSSAKVTVDYVAGSRGAVGEAIQDYQINLIALALENGETLKNYSDNVFGTGQVHDILTMTNAISGKRCIFVYALPGDAQPDETIAGCSSNWVDLKNVTGARDNIAAIKAKPSIDDDMAAGYMGMIVTTHPHKTMTFAEPHMGIKEQETLLNRTKFKEGQIATIMKRRQLSGNPFLISYGYAFGSGDTSRVHGTRCRYIIAQTLINNLWGLLAERDTLVSVEGCNKIESRIEGTFNSLINSEIVDEFIDVTIPIKSDLEENNETAKLANQLNWIPGVEVTYKWYHSVEKIVIKRVANTAV